MVEWALRPGDSRVEAYFIGSNKTGKHWCLFHCMVDDLHPWSTRYLKTRSIAMVEKGNLELEAAAILWLECAWRFEREHWGKRRQWYQGTIKNQKSSIIRHIVWDNF